MINAISTLRTHLAADSPLGALVSSRIYSPDLPATYDFSVGGRSDALTFKAVGGDHEDPTPVVHVSFEFKGWALSAVRAHEIFMRVFDALHGIQNVTVGGVDIMHARIESGPVQIEDPDVENLHICQGSAGVTFRNP